MIPEVGLRRTLCGSSKPCSVAPPTILPPASAIARLFTGFGRPESPPCLLLERREEG